MLLVVACIRVASRYVIEIVNVSLIVQTKTLRGYVVVLEIIQCCG